VAFSRSERAYKRYAHFEVGICYDGVFVRFSLKPESEEDDKPGLLAYLRDTGLNALLIKDPDPVYYYDNDHGQGPRDVRSLTEDDFSAIIDRTRVKSRSFAVGLVFDRNQPIVQSAEFVTRAHNVIRHLAPLYQGTLALKEVLPR